MSAAGRIGDPGPRPAFPGPRAVLADIRYERAAKKRVPLPAGDNSFSVSRTFRARREVLDVILEGYRRHGPVYGLRILHGYQVMMIGPEANHFMLVSGRENFAWRHGRMGDLITLIGDGLLTTDGDYHDTSRAIMMPSFHRERVEQAARVMSAEASAAVAAAQPGSTLDVYHWTRDLAMRIAMGALFGFDPDSGHGAEVAARFESGLSFHAREFILQALVGPGTPYRKLVRDRAALERLVGEEIRRRRTSAEESSGVLGSLMESTDEEGRSLTDTQVLDHVLTLLFAGHDTTTSTVTFLMYELARRPEWREILQRELDEVVGAREPTPEELFGGLPLLTQAIDEALRMYPPAWIGARRSVHDYEFAGVRVPAGIPVSYCSWASHRLPEVFPDPNAFRPERFAPDERAKFPRGAYVPFGMGPRVCIGKRFGYTEVHAIAAALLARFSPELVPGYRMRIQQAPTLSPKDGLPMILRPRA